MKYLFVCILLMVGFTADAQRLVGHKIILDGKVIDELSLDSAFANPSDLRISSQLAVKRYVDNHTGGASTDNQGLSLTGDSLIIERGGGIELADLADNLASELPAQPTFANGVGLSAGVAKWGYPLTENTTIDVGSNWLQFGGSGTIRIGESNSAQPGIKLLVKGNNALSTEYTVSVMNGIGDDLFKIRNDGYLLGSIVKDQVGLTSRGYLNYYTNSMPVTVYNGTTNLLAGASTKFDVQLDGVDYTDNLLFTPNNGNSKTINLGDSLVINIDLTTHFGPNGITYGQGDFIFHHFSNRTWKDIEITVTDKDNNTFVFDNEVFLYANATGATTEGLGSAVPGNNVPINFTKNIALPAGVAPFADGTTGRFVTKVAINRTFVTNISIKIRANDVGNPCWLSFIEWRPNTPILNESPCLNNYEDQNVYNKFIFYEGSDLANDKTLTIDNDNGYLILEDNTFNPTYEAKHNTGVRAALRALNAQGRVGTFSNHNFEIMTNDLTRVNVLSSGDLQLANYGTGRTTAGLPTRILGTTNTAGDLVTHSLTDLVAGLNTIGGIGDWYTSATHAWNNKDVLINTSTVATGMELAVNGDVGLMGGGDLYAENGAVPAVVIDIDDTSDSVAFGGATWDVLTFAANEVVELKGGLQRKGTSHVSSATIDNTSYNKQFNPGSGVTHTATLPANPKLWEEYCIILYGAGTVDIVPSGGKNLNGSTSAVSITANYDSVIVKYNGLEWIAK